MRQIFILLKGQFYFIESWQALEYAFVLFLVISYMK